MPSKINNILIIALFLIAIILPLVFSDKTGGKISVLENRYLAPFPTILTSDMKLAPGINSGIENWINDNVGFRAQMKKLQADIDFHVFHTSPSSRVHIGENGWYYYTGENNLQIAMGTYPLTQDLLEKIRENQVKIQLALRKKGIEYVIVFTPSKVSIYPEYIGGGNFAVRKTVIDIVSDYLRNNTTIPIINLKPDLLQAKTSKIVYLKTDTHWNEAGAYIGYRSVINTLNTLGMIHSDPVDISTSLSTNKGEFSAMMGDEDLLPPEPMDTTQIVSPNAVQITSGEYFTNMQAILQINNIPVQNYIYRNIKAENKRLLIFGDSFFVTWKMPELFAENFSSLDVINSYYIRNNVVEQVKPEIVILERTERAIFTLAEPLDPALIYEPLKNPQAEIISETTPTKVKPGKKYEIDITVKNTGTETWNEDHRIRLAIFQDGYDRYRLMLPDGVEVKPGEIYTFKFIDFQAPPEKSTYLEYQMVEEDVVYFGEKKRVDITIT